MRVTGTDGLDIAYAVSRSRCGIRSSLVYTSLIRRLYANPTKFTKWASTLWKLRLVYVCYGKAVYSLSIGLRCDEKLPSEVLDLVLAIQKASGAETGNHSNSESGQRREVNKRWINYVEQ